METLSSHVNNRERSTGFHSRNWNRCFIWRRNAPPSTLFPNLRAFRFHFLFPRLLVLFVTKPLPSNIWCGVWFGLGRRMQTCRSSRGAACLPRYSLHEQWLTHAPPVPPGTSQRLHWLPIWGWGGWGGVGVKIIHLPSAFPHRAVDRNSLITLLTTSKFEEIS